MTCKHKTIKLDCSYCRRKIKKFDTEIEFQLHNISEACNKLGSDVCNLSGATKQRTRLDDAIFNAISKIEKACEAINKEIKQDNTNNKSLW